ncbi:MAG TPA: exodeoxyribonuclease III [Candidatus Polarisedimenticolia bacterium]|nr:exodeoxyribonuclease III [Candidatus Polarisedimenticolia bacterium]
MRIATWNVNSLKARLDAVNNWLARGSPDVLLMQETKLSDDDAPVMPFAMAGYDLVHHGEGRWNGVAIAVRQGTDVSEVQTNFDDRPVRDSGPGASGDFSEDDFDPFDEARMLSVRLSPPGSDPFRIVSLYGPNGRVVDSPFYRGKLAWFDRLRRWLDETRDPTEPLILGGDLNIAPTPDDVWNEKAVHGGTHVSEPERATFRHLLDWGLTDAYRAKSDARGRFTWWDYRAGNFHKNFGMRIDHLLVTKPIADRLVAAEIDREARKGPPIPSDHAPLTIDLDEPGKPFDPDWDGALRRIALRTR